MSDFQLGLLAIGALAVVAVYAFNSWQERAARRTAQAAFKRTHSDALLEPVAATAQRIEPGFDPPQRAARHADAAHLRTALPDPRIDYVLDLTARQPVTTPNLVQAWASAEHRFAQRALFAGAAEAGWEPCAPDGKYTRLRAALQLVNRRGLVNDGELLEFRAEVETLAARLNASVAAAEMSQALERGRALDALCADADIQVVLHVVPGDQGRFDAATVCRIAQAAGLVSGSDGRYLQRDPDERDRYVLYDRSGAPLAPEHAEQVPALSLALDVPRAPDTARSFESMARLAQDLAQALGGRLVDDNDQALDGQALAEIGRQLEAVRARLEAADIAPGSAVALRLFS